MSEPSITLDTKVEDNPTQISQSDLEKMTNEAYGADFPTPESQPQVEVEPETVETPAKPQGGQVESENLKNIFGETPYKGDDVIDSAKKLVDGYKNIQAQYSKLTEEVKQTKPYEQLLKDAIADPQFAQYLQQVQTLYRNPQLASAYVNQQGGVDAPPDPRQYDLYDASQLQAYQEAQANYINRQLDGRINARFAEVDANTRLDKMKFELKQQFPDIDPEEVITKTRAKMGKWTLADAYKALEYDNLEGKLTEKIRGELTAKMKTAQTNTTPTATGGARPQVSVTDILSHIAKNGGDSARKKYGDKAFVEALQQTEI